VSAFGSFIFWVDGKDQKGRKVRDRGPWGSKAGEGGFFGGRGFLRWSVGFRGQGNVDRLMGFWKELL
jgi:hypothetical protein